MKLVRRSRAIRERPLLEPLDVAAVERALP
jgi:hypothetical protein